MTYRLLGLAICCEVAATLLLNASEGFVRWRYGLASVALYAVAGLLLSLVLRHMAVGLAYAIWAGAGIALICAASALIWKQRLDLPAFAGIGLIVIGVWLVAAKSRVVLH